MPDSLFVVSSPERWPIAIEGVELVSARRYLTDPQYASMRNCRVYNLSRSYRYQSLGYYVSLLAEARSHRPLPSVSTIQDLKYQSLFKVVSNELDELIQKSLAPLQSDHFVLSIYFARNVAKRYDKLARHLFNLFPAPLLRASFVKTEDGWELRDISALSTRDVPQEHRSYIVEFAGRYFSKGTGKVLRKKRPRFHMAVLFDSKDPTPPSDEKAIQKFCSAADAVGIGTEIITKDDYGRIAEFDALFIRETTAVNNHTYRFARKAEAEGLVVLDDPTSIVRCTNKVYLAELLGRHGVSTPKTMICHKENLDEVRQTLGFPCILKQPDSSFSQGVVKASSVEEFDEWVNKMLETSDLLIAQEYLKTDFDWRIGVLDRKPLYACKYFMARGHWQIYNNSAGKESNDFTGGFETIPVELAPRRVVSTALKAANLIGDGLYGVDLKEDGNKCHIIEVNDNPSIDSGVEDKIIRGALYERIMEVFLRRLEQRRAAFAPAVS